MTGRRAATYLSPLQRSFRESLVEILALAYALSVLLIVVFLLLSALTNRWLQYASWRLFAVGVAVDTSWVLPSLLGVSIVLYAALVGGAIVAPSRSFEVRTTNNLGRGSQAIAALAIIYGLITATGAALDHSMMGHLFSAVVVSCIVVAIGASAGAFASGSVAERREAAFRARSVDERVLAKLPFTGRPLRSYVGLIGNLLIVPALPIVYIASSGWRPLTPDKLLVCVIFELLANPMAFTICVGGFFLLIDRGSRATKLIVSLPPLAGFTALLIVAFYPVPGFEGTNLTAGIMYLIAGLFVGASVVVPLIPRLRGRYRWSIGHALGVLAARHLEQDREQWGERLIRLDTLSSRDMLLGEREA